jgi:HrpA-like RNA helicase
MSSSSAMIPFTNQPFSTSAQALRAKAQELPVSQYLGKIKETVDQNIVTIIVAETGSGKTTQVPQAFLQSLADGTDMAVTQNRRLAAELVS